MSITTDTFLTIVAYSVVVAMFPALLVALIIIHSRRQKAKPMLTIYIDPSHDEQPPRDVDAYVRGVLIAAANQPGSPLTITTNSDEVITKFLEVIEELKIDRRNVIFLGSFPRAQTPKLVITYDPIVGTACPDGMAVHNAAALVQDALRGTGPIYHTTSSSLLIDAVRLQVVQGQFNAEHLTFRFMNKNLVVNSKGRLPEWPRGFCDYQIKILGSLCRGGMPDE